MSGVEPQHRAPSPRTTKIPQQQQTANEAIAANVKAPIEQLEEGTKA